LNPRQGILAPWFAQVQWLLVKKQKRIGVECR
jgi:hypothetical protein